MYLTNFSFHPFQDVKSVSIINVNRKRIIVTIKSKKYFMHHKKNYSKILKTSFCIKTFLSSNYIIYIKKILLLQFIIINAHAMERSCKEIFWNKILINFNDSLWIFFLVFRLARIGLFQSSRKIAGFAYYTITVVN